MSHNLSREDMVKKLNETLDVADPEIFELITKEKISIKKCHFSCPRVVPRVYYKQLNS